MSENSIPFRKAFLSTPMYGMGCATLRTLTVGASFSRPVIAQRLPLALRPPHRLLLAKKASADYQLCLS
jgi:hypothetical protein